MKNVRTYWREYLLTVLCALLIFIPPTRMVADVVKGTSAGFVTVQPTDDPAGTDLRMDYVANVYPRAVLDTAPAGATTITEVGWYCDNATSEANYEMGIYDHNVTDNEPDAVLYSDTTNAKGTDAGWKRITVNWSITAGTKYWIALQLDATDTETFTNYTALVGELGSRASQSQALPDPWDNGTESTAYMSFYAVYATGGESTPIANLIPLDKSGGKSNSKNGGKS